MLISRYVVTLVLFAASMTVGQNKQVEFALRPDGTVPVWLVAGPFEQSISGFGAVEDEQAFPEKNIQPWVGKPESASLITGGTAEWSAISVNSNSYTDINTIMGFLPPAHTAISPWYGRAAYLGIYIKTEEAKEIILLTGSYGELKVLLNGIELGKQNATRQAAPDQDEFTLNLQAGTNFLLIKVFHSHNNYSPDFFVDNGYGWGIFGRLVSKDNEPLNNVKISFRDDRDKTGFEIVSTFFFKDSTDGNLYQRFDILVNSVQIEQQNGLFETNIAGKNLSLALENINYGINRRQMWFPAVSADRPVKCKLTLGHESIESSIILEEKPRYELYFTMLSHMDIGYTSPQPIVQERQVRTLNEIIDACDKDPNFRWTIETIWQLEQFRLGANPQRFQRLIDLIKSGRISVSPWYSNSFSAMVSEEEMLRSLVKAGQYQDEFGIVFPVAVFDDTPGLNWQVPQALTSVGTDFLVCGINEVYTDLPLQMNLPKYFSWSGGDGSKIRTYITETYTEGVLLGLEKNATATAVRLWQYLSQLKFRSYPYDKVLILSAWGDNNGIPQVQYRNILKWNDEYAYPKFIVSNLTQFKTEFLQAYPDEPTVMHGDWTSSWESRFQGEPHLMERQRWVQYNLPGVEKLNTINWLLDPDLRPLDVDVDQIYQWLLNFSGHGSGMEYGYGSRSENLLTLAYREQYIDNAYYKTHELNSRVIYRQSIAEESFDNEAILVYNPLSWERDAVLSLDFPAVFSDAVQLIDLAENEVIPCYASGDRLQFVVPSLPSVGYKKIGIERKHWQEPVRSHLETGDDFIANEYYRLAIDPINGTVRSIIDLPARQEIASTVKRCQFAQPVKLLPLSDTAAYPVSAARPEISLDDFCPAGVALRIDTPGELFTRIEYALYAGQPWIDLNYTIDFTRLESPAAVEEYGIILPVDDELVNFSIDLAGGALTSTAAILPGAETGYYSIREGFSVYDSKRWITYALNNSRIIKQTSEKSGQWNFVVILANNFPEQWNRSEANDQKLTFTIRLTSGTGQFDPAAADRFGWETNSSPLYYHTWQDSDPGQKSYFSSSDPGVQITAIKSDKTAAVQLRLVNTSAKPVKTAITSSFINDSQVTEVNPWGKPVKDIKPRKDMFKVSLDPNEIKTIRVKPAIK